jgi:hypothetical protein
MTMVESQQQAPPLPPKDSRLALSKLKLLAFVMLSISVLILTYVAIASSWVIGSWAGAVWFLFLLEAAFLIINHLNSAKARRRKDYDSGREKPNPK